MDKLAKQRYRIVELSQLTGKSVRTIIRWFEHEPGVLRIKRPETLHKRRYTLRSVPRAVVQKVLIERGLSGCI